MAKYKSLKALVGAASNKKNVIAKPNELKGGERKMAKKKPRKNRKSLYGY